MSPYCNNHPGRVTTGGVVRLKRAFVKTWVHVDVRGTQCVVRPSDSHESFIQTLSPELSPVSILAATRERAALVSFHTTRIRKRDQVRGVWLEGSLPSLEETADQETQD